MQDLTDCSDIIENQPCIQSGVISFTVHSKMHCGLSCSFLSFFMSALLLPGKQGKSCIPPCQCAPLSVKFLLLQVFRLWLMQMCTISVSALTLTFSIIPYKKTTLSLQRSLFTSVVVSVSFSNIHDHLLVEDKFWQQPLGRIQLPGFWHLVQFETPSYPVCFSAATQPCGQLILNQKPTC